MKKCLCLMALCLALPAWSADLADWKSGQAKDLSALPAPVRVVNVWATWCVPCRKEMPALSAWFRRQPKKSVALVGVAIDSRDNIARFLKTTPVAYPVWRYTGQDSRAFMKALGNEVGGLPFTQVSARGCGFTQAVTGEVDGAKLDAAVKKVRAACKV